MMMNSSNSVTARIVGFKNIHYEQVYGREIWFLTLREEHRLKVFEKRVLRREYLDRREIK
jgi:hypothetical protein